MSSEFSFDVLEDSAVWPAAAAGGAFGAGDAGGVAIGEAEAIREAARQEGYDAGRLEAVTEARMDLEPAAAALAAAADDLVRAAAARAAELEREAVELALAIAEKVVAGAIEAQPERVADVVAGALRTLVERERVVVAVHPEDAPLVRRTVEDVAGSLGGVEAVDVQADRRVSRGGAVVRTDGGEVDASLDVKLECARDAIVRELRDRP